MNLLSTLVVLATLSVFAEAPNIEHVQRSSYNRIARRGNDDGTDGQRLAKGNQIPPADGTSPPPPPASSPPPVNNPPPNNRPPSRRADNNSPPPADNNNPPPASPCPSSAASKSALGSSLFLVGS